MCMKVGWTERFCKRICAIEFGIDFDYLYEVLRDKVTNTMKFGFNMFELAVLYWID